MPWMLVYPISVLKEIPTGSISAQTNDAKRTIMWFRLHTKLFLPAFFFFSSVHRCQSKQCVTRGTTWTEKVHCLQVRGAPPPPPRDHVCRVDGHVWSEYQQCGKRGLINTSRNARYHAAEKICLFPHLLPTCVFRAMHDKMNAKVYEKFILIAKMPRSQLSLNAVKKDKHKQYSCLLTLFCFRMK